MPSLDSTLTVDELKQRLKYDPETGIFTWLAGTQYANQVAGTYETSEGRRTGYIRIVIKGRRYQAHRLAFLYMTGRFPDDQIDHIDGDGCNNAWTNLREICAKGNALNRPLRRDNQSKIQGVYWNRHRNKWYAEIKHACIKHHLYAGADFFEACCARKSAEARLCIHPNHGRCD